MMVTRRAVAIGGVLRGMRCTVRAMLSSSALGGPRAAAVRQEELLQALRAHVMEPVSQKDIVSVGALQNMKVGSDGEVTLTLDLFTARHPDEQKIVTDCKSAVTTHVPWARSVQVDVVRRPPRNAFARRDSALSRVQQIVAVSSCKGGVGKSTVAVNLALSMAASGLRVGLLDADVYGPSLPFMLIPDSYDVKRSASNDRWVVPLNSHGVRCMSFGWVSPAAGVPGAGGREAAVLRGPLASKVLNQLLLMTEWGELDFLIVDMPPGTGDLQMTLTQSVSLSGAVLVTTPHTLSVADLVKGATMFRTVDVPVLAVVENMSYFTCDAGKIYQLFGPSGERHLRKSIAALSGIITDTPAPANTGCGGSNAGPTKGSRIDGTGSTLMDCPHYSLPIMRGPVFEELRGAPSAGVDIDLPAVLRAPQSEEATVFSTLATDVARQVLRTEINAQLIPSVTYVKGKGLLLRYFTSSSATELLISCKDLRMRDPRTGLPRADFHGRLLEEANNVEPVTVEPKGSYGVALVWSDAGRTSDIYTYDALRTAAMSLRPQHSA